MSSVGARLRSSPPLTRGRQRAAAALGTGVLSSCMASPRTMSPPGALVPIMTDHPPPPAGVYVVRPPGQQPARKVRVLTDMLIECFEQASIDAGDGR